MVIKNILINGDSFLCIDKTCKTTVGIELAKKFNLNIFSFPGKRGQKSPGLAKGGRGNDRIIATTKAFLYANPELMENTFVLIGWSHTVRNDYITTASHKKLYDQFLSWITWKVTKSFWGNPEGFLPELYCLSKNLRLRHLSHILSLQDFFESHGIKYLMYDALTNDYLKSDALLDILSEQVNKKTFFEFDKLSHLRFVSEDTDKIGQQLTRKPKGKDDHPNALGCELWADKLEVFIKENSLL